MLSLGVYSGLITGFKFDPDAEAGFIAAGIINVDQKVRINRLIVSATNDGRWSDLQCLYFFDLGDST